MSDGRRPGPLGGAHGFRQSTGWGIASTAAFSTPPPLGFAPSLPAMLDGEGSDLTIIPGEARHRPGGSPQASATPGPAPRPSVGDPAPTPIVGSGGVLMGPLGPRSQLVADYYQQCGLETIGPGQLVTNRLARFTTLEGLIDLLLARPESQQVIVNHGSPESGLLVPVCKETRFSNTGVVMSDFSGLADMAEKGPIDPKNQITRVLLDGVTRDLGVRAPVILRIVDKLVALRRKRLVLHFRACNLDDPQMVRTYKTAFGATMITFHGCRLLFMRCSPAQMKAGRHVAEFNGDDNTTKARLRTFDDPLGLLSPMLLAIVDRDGHTQVDDESFLERRSPSEVRGWAISLLRVWKEESPASFVIPVMWENTETTFHCPLEPGWRDKLRFV
jgi:hypothetical protein